MKRDANGRYHLRRGDRSLSDPIEGLQAVRTGRHLTLALCRDNEPYLVTLCYVFVEGERCFYVHGAPRGKKLDFIRANPRVWGQVLEDRGYVPGEATYSYRTVMFEALAEFVTEPADKVRALQLLIERYEPDSEAVKSRMLKPDTLDRVVVLRLRVLAMTGKQGPPPRSVEGGEEDPG